MEKERNKAEWDEAGVSAGRFEAFRQVVAALRSENGCPWDREQTFESLKPCMINEMTEAIAAINIYKEEKDAENLCEELGDVLLQVVLLAQIAQEEGLFQIEDVIRGISRKMIRRHPHVFHDPEMEAALRQLQEENVREAVSEEAEADLQNAQETASEATPESVRIVSSQTGSSSSRTSAEIPGLWDLIKRAERQGRQPKDKEKERAAFAVAAGEVVAHLQKKTAEKS